MCVFSVSISLYVVSSRSSAVRVFDLVCIILIVVRSRVGIFV